MRHALCIAFLSLLTCAAGAVEIMGTLPGVDALEAGWSAAGPWLCSGGELRRVALDTGPGGLLLQGRLTLDAPADEMAMGSRLAALRASNGGLRFIDLELGTSTASPVLCSALTRGEQSLLAAGPGGLWRGRLDMADPGLAQVLGPFGEAPSALCGNMGLAWLVAADTLRGWGLGDPPVPLGRLRLPGVARLAEHGERLLACRGEQGLSVVDLSDPFAPVAWTWQAGFPVWDAAWWREQVFALALGDSGLALLDAADPQAPQLLGRWRTVRRAERLSLKDDSLLVAEGAAGLSLHVLRQDMAGSFPEQLARHNTRPRLLSVPVVDDEADELAAWCLDANQGFRRLRWPAWPEDANPVETAGVALSLPVDGGDIADDPFTSADLPLFAGCRYGAGLSYYAETGSGIVLRGIYPSDPVKLLAWGPDDLIAYVTPQAFVAIKQANRNPWFLRHHGTIDLQAEPLSVAWSDHFLLVGCADGRVFCVNVGDPAAPVLETVLQLAGPVRSLGASRFTYQNEVAAAAGPLYLLNRPEGSSFQVADSALAAGDFVASCHTGFGVAATRDPHQVMEFGFSPDTGLALDAPVDLPAPPQAVGRCYTGGTCGHGLLGLENGDLLSLGLINEIAVDPGPTRPGALALAARPNPFNPVTQLSFTLATPVDEARLSIFNLAGRLVEYRELGPLPAGTRELDVDGARWPSGLYLARLEAGEWSAVAKLLLVR